MKDKETVQILIAFLHVVCGIGLVVIGFTVLEMLHTDQPINQDAFAAFLFFGLSWLVSSGHFFKEFTK